MKHSHHEHKIYNGPVYLHTDYFSFTAMGKCLLRVNSKEKALDKGNIN